MCPCEACDQTGKVYTWLEIASSTRQDVRIHPVDIASRLHPNVRDPKDFDISRWCNAIEKQKALAPEQLPDVPFPLRPQLDALRDRATNTRVQQFIATVFELEYATAFGSGMVELSGTPLRVIRADRNPLRRRTACALAVGLLGFAATLAAIGAYRSRHAWYLHHGAWPTAFGLALAGCVFAIVAVYGWARAARARTKLCTAAPASAATIGTAAAALVLALSGPSSADARAALSAGRLDDASLTVSALLSAGTSGAEINALVDDIHLGRLHEASTLEAAVASAQGPWKLPASRSAATSSLRDRVSKLARDQRAHGDGAALERTSVLISKVLPNDARGLRIDAAHLISMSCISAGDVVCAERRWTELREIGSPERAIVVRDAFAASDALRLRALIESAATRQAPREAVLDLEAALEVLARQARLRVPADERTTTRIHVDLAHARSAAERLEREEAARAAREATAQERRAQQERRRAEAAARREERLEAARSRQYAPLLCCDGSFSPSCICAGSHRGCCSHHGGVCGCSQ